jgi:phosphinothricin acetyltransferase
MPPTTVFLTRCGGHRRLGCVIQLIDCDNAHAEAILRIFNQAIADSTALYEYQPRTMEMIQGWLARKRAGDFPIIGAVDQQGTLLGFGSYGPFRAFPAYKYTVEHSVYIGTDHRGKGLGKALLNELISRAIAQQYHVMVAAIDSQNQASIVLHEKLGFQRCGLMPQVGFKFGRWLDLALYQMLLPTPTKPVEG